MFAGVVICFFLCQVALLTLIFRVCKYSKKTKPPWIFCHVGSVFWCIFTDLYESEQSEIMATSWILMFQIKKVAYRRLYFNGNINVYDLICMTFSRSNCQWMLWFKFVLPKAIVFKSFVSWLLLWSQNKNILKFANLFWSFFDTQHNFYRNKVKFLKTLFLGKFFSLKTYFDSVCLQPVTAMWTRSLY